LRRGWLEKRRRRRLEGEAKKVLETW